MQFHGWRGVVEVNTQTTPRRATKKALDKNRYGAIQKEADILYKLQGAGITFVPQLHERGEGRFSYTRIVGDAFDKVFEKQSSQIKYQLIDEFIDKAYKLDCLGIVHGELDRPMNNILVDTEKMSNNKPSISFIDFERGCWQDFSGKNLRHVTQRLHRVGLISLESCKKYGKYNAKKLYTTLKMKMNQKNNNILKSKEIKSFGGAIFSILVLLALDLVSKWLFYDMSWGDSLWLFTPVFNTGVGRSLPVPLWITISLAILLSGGVIYRMKKNNLFPRRALLLIAGAWGNGIDRILFGGVRDFIDVHYRPVFNFADIYLTLSIGLLIFFTYTNKNNKLT